MLNRRVFVGAGASVVAASFGPPARASAGPITMYCGFPPGGGPDTIARIVADHMRTLGTNILVDNKVGAGGRIAMENAKRAAPDGRSLCLTPGSMLSIYPHVYSKLSYRAEDFTPIAKVAAYPLGLAVPIESGHTSLQEFLQWCMKNPGKATCGLPGLGNDTNILSWKLGNAASIKFEPVPYQGGPQLTQAVLGNQIACAVNVVSNFADLHKSGKVRLLAISSASRSSRIPEVPTFIELGLKDCFSEESLGILGPRGVPPALVKALSDQFVQTASNPDVQRLILARDHLPQPEDSARFTRTIAEAYARRGREIQEAGFSKLD